MARLAQAPAELGVILVSQGLLHGVVTSARRARRDAADGHVGQEVVGSIDGDEPVVGRGLADLRVDVIR